LSAGVALSHSQAIPVTSLQGAATRTGADIRSIAAALQHYRPELAG